MKINFDIDNFIKERVTARQQNLCSKDLQSRATELNEAIQGKSLLVIGGAGTIGAAFIKSCLNYEPASLTVFDISENGLTELVRDLRSTPGLKVPKQFITYPVDFGDAVFRKFMAANGKFDIVANFAAHKHVRSEKDPYSIEALIRNNVIKTRMLFETLTDQCPEHFFCVSTDKAANPANVMGASKKIMEEMILGYQDTMKVTTARFANVAFSNGSLPDGFLSRIAKLQPLSTPSDVKRYFVSPAESGEICMLACICGKNGEILFPKLASESMQRFYDIAIDLVEALGYKPLLCTTEETARLASLELAKGSTQYPIYHFASDTMGEKLYEEFYTESEMVDLKKFSSLGVVSKTDRHSKTEVLQFVDKLEKLFATNVDKSKIVATIESFIPTFAHVDKGLSLDSKM